MSVHRQLAREAFQHPGRLVLTILLGVGAGAAGIGQAWLFSQIVQGAFLSQQGLVELSGLLAGLAGLAAGRAGLQMAADSSSSTLAAAVKNHLRQQTLDHLIAAGPVGLQREQTGELANTLTSGIEALDGYFSQYLPQIAYAMTLPLAVLAVVLPIDLLSGLILLVTGPLIPFFLFLIGSTSANLTQRQWTVLSRMSAYFLDVIQGLTTLKILGRSREQAMTIAEVSEHYRQATMSVLKVTFLSALTLELLSTLSTAIVAVQVGLRLLYGQIDFQPAFFILVLAPEFYLPLRLLGQRFHTGSAGAATGKRIFTILEATSEAKGLRSSESTSQGETEIDLSDGVYFERVGFQYEAGQPILHELTFHLPADRVTALVGLSGAGKSTLASLLLGFIQPTSGCIRAGKKELADISQAAWHNQIAWVPQNPYLFNDSVLANLRLGDPQANMEAVQLAARLAGASEFIEAMPQGYETRIGERGARLSGGQAQRLALGRAFLKNAPLVILDEPDAHLDPESAHAFSEALPHLAQGRTVLVIAHRTSTILQADQVITLEAGRPVQTSAPQFENQVTRMTEVVTANKHAGRIAADLKGESPDTKHKPLGFLLGMLRPFSRQVALSVLLGFGTVASSAGLMGSAAYIIARAAQQPSIADLQIAIVGVRFFGLARGILRYLERLASHQATFQVLARLRTTFYKTLEPLAPARLLYRQSGDLLSRIVSDIGSLEDFYVRGAAPLLTALLTVLAACLFFGFWSAEMSLVLLLLTLAAGIGLPALAIWLGRKTGKLEVQARARLHSVTIDLLQGLPDLLVFGQLGKQRQRALQEAKTLDRLHQASSRHNAHLNALGSFLAYAGLWGILALSIQLASAGGLDRLAIGALALVALASFEAVQALPQAARQLSVQVAATERLLEITREADSTVAISPALAVEPLPEAFNLEVHDLDFTYPGETQAALQGLNLSLEAGKLLAIVGPSGAGKSTLVNLLLRFWEPQGGSIRLGGKDIQQPDPDKLRKAIAVLPQQVYLFSGTLADNLRLVCPEATIDKMLSACHQAQLKALLESLPQGLETWVGEGGVRLSAGERQRLALARALLKDSALLVLDEPTAHLDPQTAQAVWETLRQRRVDQSILLISHQLAGLENADEIIVLDRGRTVERGSFQRLLSQDGLFRRMWELEQISR